MYYSLSKQNFEKAKIVDAQDFMYRFTLRLFNSLMHEFGLLEAEDGGEHGRKGGVL
jgi:hypothetical protein